MANKTSEEVERTGTATGEKLRACGCKDTDALLERGGTKKGREKLAAESGISEKQILKWVNMVDLFRIKGIGGEFAELLEAAGVDTVPELAQRNAANLAAKCAELCLRLCVKERTRNTLYQLRDTKGSTKGQ